MSLSCLPRHAGQMRKCLICTCLSGTLCGCQVRYVNVLKQSEVMKYRKRKFVPGECMHIYQRAVKGFNIFYDMLDAIRFEIASKVFRIRVQTDEGTTQRQTRTITMNAQHKAMESFDSTRSMQNAASPMAQGRQRENVTVVRSAPKVGRNEPCPCGSGKKYKQCCGK